ncbi:MAG: type II secretion system protein [Deltaproteobacteria bacterium]|nr:type II secretion system protein [Deltaproteobacteria bacterium]
MNLKSNRGFTLIELIITLTVILILSAMGLYVYYGVIGKADTGGIVNNVNQLKNVSQIYAEDTGGSFYGISAAALQADGVLPPNWTVLDNQAIPPDTSIVSAYYIGQGADGMTGDSFDIGFMGPQITNNIVKSVCIGFENQIAEFGYDGSAYPISTEGTNCNVIPSNNTLITNWFILGFE